MLTQPVTPELREWLMAQLRAGFGEAEVVAAMLASGWDEAVAREALAGVLATLPVEPPAASPVSRRRPPSTNRRCRSRSSRPSCSRRPTRRRRRWPS